MKSVPPESSARKLRVLFVGAFQPPPGSSIRGGQLAACRAIVDSPLSRHVDWITLDSTMESVPPPPVPRRAWLATTRVVQILLLLISRRVDTVLLFAPNGLGIYEKGLMALIGHALGKWVVLCPRGGPIIDEYRTSRLLRWFLPFVLRRCDRIVCQGQSWQTFFGCIAQRPETTLPVIANGLDPGRYLELSYPPLRTHVTVSMLCWLDRNKGVFDLVEVVTRFRSELARVRFVIGGHGQAWDELHRLVELRGLQDFFLLSGWLDDERKLELLAKTDVFLMISHREGLPNALLEAMAAGRAVIATAVGAVPDVLEDGVNGLLCSVGDIDAIGRHLLQLTTDHRRRIELGTAARATIIAHHDIRKTWPQWLGALHSGHSGAFGAIM